MPASGRSALLKPQAARINPATSLSRGLIQAWTFTEGGGARTRRLIPNDARYLDFTTINAWEKSSYGPALTLDGGSHTAQSSLVLPGACATAGFSVLVVIKNRGYTDTNRYVFQLGTNHITLIFGYVANAYEVYWNSGALRQTVATLTENDRRDHVILLVYNGIAGTFQAYYDGVKTVDVGTGITLDTENLRTIYIGASGAAAGDGPHAAFSCLAMWQRPLGPGAARVLAVDPFAFLQRPRRARPGKPHANTAYTLSCAQGSFALTGQALNPKHGALLTVGQGSYALTGQTMTPKAGRLLTAAQGSYSLSGQAVTPKAARTLALAKGSYVLSGQDVNLVVPGRVVLDQGSFVLSGQALAFSVARRATLAQGSYALTGQSVTLTRTRVLVAAQGSYTLAGQSVNLILNTGPAIWQASADQVILLDRDTEPVFDDRAESVRLA